ncbi:MAG: T9SS type A sorting domain-containing protein [Phaeodactylibacter sp.]|jgi:DNA-binding beta-propeller fold protein YncE|uniref:T9SS type A sorting domain-containing protein n=1 Tax=Phaeodactylibacter sp. TaxID=1940289 RepID=UPI0032EDA449
MKVTHLIFVFLIAVSALSAQEYKRLNLPNNDICYVSSQDRIYAVTPGDAEVGNSLCVINPHFATVDTCFFIGSEPSVLALSPDDQYLYVGFDGTSLIKRVDLTSLSVDLTISLGFNSDNEPLFADEMLVLPGDPQALMVIHKSVFSSSEGIGIYDNGVLRAGSYSYIGSNALTVTSPENRIFGYNNSNTGFDLVELEATEEGVVQIGNYADIVNGFGVEIEAKGSVLYSDGGHIVDVSNDQPQLSATLQLPDRYAPRVEPDPDSNYIYIADRSLSDSRLYIYKFSGETYTLASTFEIVDFSDHVVRSLINWGTGKLAFNTAFDIFITQTCEPLIETVVDLEAEEYGGCTGDTVTISAPEGYENYYWSNGSRGQTLEVTSFGLFNYAVSDSTGCLSQASEDIFVGFSPQPDAPVISAFGDLPLCLGETIDLFAGGPSGIDEYIWSTGDTIRTLTVSAPGDYFVRGLEGIGCLGPPSDTFTVAYLPDSIPPQPEVFIIGDSEICQGETTQLTASDGYTYYLWATGDTTQTITVSEAGQYTVQVAQQLSCFSHPSENVYIDVLFSPPQPSIQVNGNILASTWGTGNQWFFNGEPIPGATEQFYTALESGFYTVQATSGSCDSPMSEVYNHTVVSTISLDQETISIYPNPVEEVLFVKVELNTEKSLRLALYNILGQNVSAERVISEPSTAELSLQHLPAGVYWLQAWDTRNPQDKVVLSVMKK